MKALSLTLLAMVFSIGLSAQTVNNTTSCDYKMTFYLGLPGACDSPHITGYPSYTTNISPGPTVLPTPPPGFIWFAAEIFEATGGPFIMGVASACSSCGASVSYGSYDCTISGNVLADWSICGTLTISP